MVFLEHLLRVLVEVLVILCRGHILQLPQLQLLVWGIKDKGQGLKVLDGVNKDWRFSLGRDFVERPHSFNDLFRCKAPFDDLNLEGSGSVEC